MDLKEIDPRGLMKDAYQMEGLRSEECRSIFLDWALGLPAGTDARPQIAQILDHYAQDSGDHPMTAVLKDGLAPSTTPKRRGGRRARMK